MRALGLCLALASALVLAQSTGPGGASSGAASSYDGTGVNTIATTNIDAGTISAVQARWVNADGGNLSLSGNATVAGTLTMSGAVLLGSETLTPFSGGGQTSATQITKPLAFGTPAAAGDSVKLPASPAAGTTVTVCNMSTTANRFISVFGPSGTSVNGVADGSKALQNQACGQFFASSSTSWWGGN